MLVDIDITDKPEFCGTAMFDEFIEMLVHIFFVSAAIILILAFFALILIFLYKRLKKTMKHMPHGISYEEKTANEKRMDNMLAEYGLLMSDDRKYHKAEESGEVT